jgi:putative glutamine amidotransferase
VIGITTDIVAVEGRERCAMYPSYARAVAEAGGLAVLLPHELACVHDLADRLDGFVFTGGDDPSMEEFGEVTDARATRLHPDRQHFEVALMKAVLEREKPMLGVCLGMQLLALLSGGRLNQHLEPPTAHQHWEVEHEVLVDMSDASRGVSLRDGTVLSRHKQAVTDPGTMRVLARSSDGLIEAIGADGRTFCMGVQWHPERTRERALGGALFEALVAAARGV